MAGTAQCSPALHSSRACRTSRISAQWSAPRQLSKPVFAPAVRVQGLVGKEAAAARLSFGVTICAVGLSSRFKSAPVVAAVASNDVAEEPEAKAILRFTRGSPYKMRRVLDQIRGRTYEEALILLEYMPYRACEPILKTLVSAAANAKHNLGLKKSKLYVSECFANQGPVLKRFKPRAKGRADKICKPLSHITIKVKERDDKKE